MRKLTMMIFLAGMSWSANLLAEPAPVDNAVPPCDSVQGTDKPPCNTDADSLRVPAPLPNEDESVIRPPVPPASGLPGSGKGDPGLPRPAHPPQP